MTTKSADGVALALSESMPSLEGEARTLALTLVRLLAEGEPVTMAAFAEAAGVERGVVEELPVDRQDRAGAIAMPAKGEAVARTASPDADTNSLTIARVPVERRPRGDDGVSRSMTRAGPL